jgi:hypothetical protein
LSNGRERFKTVPYKTFCLNTSPTGDLAVRSLRRGGAEIVARGRSHPGREDNQGDQIRKDLEAVHGVGIVPYGLHLGDGAHEDQPAIDPGVDFEDVGSKDVSEAELTVIGKWVYLSSEKGASLHISVDTAGEIR